MSAVAYPFALNFSESICEFFESDPFQSVVNKNCKFNIMLIGEFDALSVIFASSFLDSESFISTHR